MAGRRQHFIPQFLLRGFLSRRQRGQEFTCVYRKDADPFQTNIKNVGVEGFFYSAPENDADEVITTAEDRLGRLVEELRRRDGELPKFLNVAELFAHLEVRSRHLRQSFLQAGTHLVDVFFETVSDPEMFKPYVRRMLRDDPSLLEKALAKELQESGLPQSVRPMLMKQVGPLFEKALPAMAAQMSKIVTYLRAELPTRFKDIVKLGHIRALEREVAPVMKTAILSNLQFQVCRFPEPSLLLGDSMVVFHVRGQRSFKPFLEKGDDLVAVILPIAGDSMVVGAAGPYVPDVEIIRYELVQCSLELFVACEESKRNAELSSWIGENAHILPDKELREIVRTLFKG